MIADAFTPSARSLPVLSLWRGRKSVAQGRAEAEGRSPPSTFPLFDEIKDEFLAAALVDQDFEVALTPESPRAKEMETEALANAAVLETVRDAAEWLGLDDEVMEIRISLKDKVEFIRPLDPKGSMYLYAALDKERGKYFDMARMRLRMIELAFGL